MAFNIYPDTTLVVTIPPEHRERISYVTAAISGETTVQIGDQSVTLRPGENAVVERGRIVAPKRLLDDRLAALTRKLSRLG